MTERLPAKLEATALMRSVTSAGGFATILKRGDDDRGALALVVLERGRPGIVLQRRLNQSFDYEWAEIRRFSQEEPADFQKFLDSTRQNDPDSWLIELDVADAERFVAETVAKG